MNAQHTTLVPTCGQAPTVETAEITAAELRLICGGNVWHTLEHTAEQSLPNSNKFTVADGIYVGAMGASLFV